MMVFSCVIIPVRGLSFDRAGVGASATTLPVRARKGTTPEGCWSMAALVGDCSYFIAMCVQIAEMLHKNDTFLYEWFARV